MKYFETKHQRNSARITFLIAVIIAVLCFIIGPQYLDPPEEFGVAVNFGTTDFGSGSKPLSEPIKAISKTTESIPKTKSATSTASKTSEDVLTEDNQETIAINKAEQERAKAKAQAERLVEERRLEEERKKQEEAKKKEKLDQLIGGVKNANSENEGGEGPDAADGNKGNLEGNPYAPSYFGGSGPGRGGVGYGLGGRGIPTKKIFKQDCNEYGLVVVRIEVNRSGTVVNAQPGTKGTTNTHPCLLEPAKKIALSHKWPADPDAPSRQIGFVSINFDIGQ